MILLTHDLRAALIANHQKHAEPGHDPVPLVKLFSPIGAATWLATELYPDGDTLFGLADLGFQCPELGTFSLMEISAIRLPFGLRSSATCISARTGPCRSGLTRPGCWGRSRSPKSPCRGASASRF